MRNLRYLTLLVVLAALVAVGGSTAAPPTTPSTTVVMSGLNNPRGLEWGPGGWLYVAEAGAGGSTNTPCLVIRGLNQCAGATGSVSRWKEGQRQERIATGLPSYDPEIQPAMDGATGPHDISFRGGQAWVTIGMGGDPAVIRPAFGDGFGRLVRMNPTGHWRFSTDVSGYEQASNPDGGPIDTNPYGLLATHDATDVAEAGGNALLAVVKHGSISTVALFPSRPQGRRTDSVPTEVVAGPDGALYVSELTGGPFFPDEAKIWRVAGGIATPFLQGFADIVDIDWSCDGRQLYVLQIASGFLMAGPPVLLRVDPMTNTRTPIAGPELTRPTSVLVGCEKHGPDVLYVSNKGAMPAIGEVLRLVR